MKSTRFILIVLLSFMVIPIFTSCDKDDEAGGSSNNLKGFWMPMDRWRTNLREIAENKWWDSDGYSGGHECPYFINGNTVQSNDILVYAKYKPNAIYTETIGGVKFYFIETDINTYNYVVDGNNVILSNGRVYKITSDGLYRDFTYVKVKRLR